MRRAPGILPARGNHRLVLLLFLGAMFFAACGEDSGVCPSDGLPRELVGDWMECDEEWNPTTSGMRIQADGGRFGLGVDWRDGSIGLGEQMCRPGSLACAGDHLVTRWLIPGGYDTLRYSIEGDRLEMVKTDGYGGIERYRRVSIGTKIAEAASCGFTMRMYEGVFYSPEVWPVIPVRISIDSSAGGRLTFFAAGSTLTSFTIDRYRGLGTYHLGSSSSGSWATAGTTCTDALQDFRTQDDSLSSVTIYTYDKQDGHSFGAVDLHMTDLTGAKLHMTGTFNAVIGR